MGVEDLLQKHALLEADVAAYGDQVAEVNSHVAEYMKPDGPDGSGMHCRKCYVISVDTVH